MPPGLADAEPLSKQRALLEDESPHARLDGPGLYSLRRAGVRSSAQKEDEPLRLVGRHSSPDRLRARGVAREFLYLLATGAAAKLSDPEEAPQDRAGKTV